MNLEAVLSLATSAFTSPLSHARDSVRAASEQMRSSLAAVEKAVALVGVSFAALKSVEGIADGIKDVAQTGKELQGLSETTGTSVKDLVILKKAFEETGVGAEGIQMNLVMMQKALGGVNDAGQPTKQIFEQLGLSISKLQGEGTVDQLNAISGAIGKLPNQSEKAAAATAVFGRAGADMLKLFAHPDAIMDAGKAVGMQADIYQRSSGRFTELSNTLEALHGKIKGLFLGVTDAITPVLLPMLEKLKASINFVGIGEKIGETVRTVLQAFKGGQLGELVYLELKTAGVRFVGSLAGGLAAAVAVVGEVLGNTKVIGGMRDGLISAAQGMGAVLLNVFQDAFVSFQAHIEDLRTKLPSSLGGTSDRNEALGELNRIGGALSAAKGSFSQASKEVETTAQTKGLYSPEYAAAVAKETAAAKAISELTAKKQDPGLNAVASGWRGYSMNEREERIRAAGGATLGGKTAAELSSSSQSLFTSALTQLTSSGVSLKSVADAAKAAFDGVSKNVKADPKVDKQLAELWTKLNATFVANLQAPDKNPGASGDGGRFGLAGGKAPEIEGDRLAKVGLFVGHGGPANDYARRTADGVDKMVLTMQQWLQKFPGPDSSLPPLAGWAS